MASLSKSRVIAKNTIVILASNITSKVLGAFLIIILWNYLGDANYGKYAFAIALASIFVIFTDWGFDVLTVKDVARNKKLAEKYLINIALIRLIFGIFVFLTLVVLAIIAKFPFELSAIVYIIALSLILDKISGLFFAIFRAFESMEYEALTQIIWQVLQVLFVVSAIFLNLTLIKIVALLFFTSILKLIIACLLVLKKFIRQKLIIIPTSWHKFIKDAVPFALYEIFYSVYTGIIIVILTFIEGEQKVGQFNAAFQFIAFLVIIPTAIEVALFPAISQLFRTSKDMLRFAYTKIVKYAIVLILPTTIFVWIFSNELVHFLIRENWSELALKNTVTSMNIVVWMLPFLFLNHILRVVLWSAEKQSKVALNIGLAAISITALGLILIPFYSFKGAALSVLVAEIFLFGLNYYFTSIYLFKLDVKEVVLNPIAATFAMAIFLHYLKSFSFAYVSQTIFDLIITMTAIFIYVLLLFIMRTFNRSDFVLINQIIRKKV